MWMHYRVALAAALLPLFLLAPAPFSKDAAAQDAEAPAAESVVEGEVVEEDTAPADDSEPVLVANDEQPLLTDEEIDDLVAPVALYPDALLAQVFVASTFPLDVMKAERFVEDSAELSDDERAAVAEAEGWDPSVIVLATGFPTVIQRMGEEIDWTEDLGDALMVQTDDVLDGVQRMRARAQAVGNLESNAAQTVSVEDDAISIEPTEPEVVYVPTYDETAVYATPATAEPFIAAAPVDQGAVIVAQEDSGFSTGSLLATGAISFGAGLLVNELFDDDDDWNDYWDAPRRFDWNDDAFYPRPGGVGRGISAGGDVNIDVDRSRTNNLRRDRNTDLAVDRGWKPDAAKRADAKKKLEGKKLASRGGAAGGAGAALANRGNGAGAELAYRGGGNAAAAAGGGSRAELQSKLKARKDGGGGGNAKAKVQARKAEGGGDRGAALKAKAGERKAAAKGGAFTANKGKLKDVKKAQNRGKGSAAKANISKAGGKQQAVAKAKAGGGGKKFANQGGGKKIAKKGGGKGGAFKKGGGHKKAAARGKKSGGKMKRRRG